MYPLIVDIELWLPPHSMEVPLDGKTVASRCQDETGLPPEVVLGLNFVPDDHEIRALRRLIQMSEIRIEDFRDFCTKRSLPLDPENARSAAEFLAFTFGQPLAWLHFPADSHGLAMAKKLMKWAHENNLEVWSEGEPLSDAQVYSFWQNEA